MQRRLHFELLVIASALCLVAARASAADDAAPATAAEQEQFFETRVRPLLARHCFSCHGADKQEAGLRLDARDAVFKGADAGPVIVPGKPDESRLIGALRYNGDVQMPPDGKLSDADLRTFVAWVKLGAPWPGSASPVAAPVPEDLAARIVSARQNHWAFQPVRRVEPPAAADDAWSATPIDRFVLAKLGEHGLRPSPAADRRTLLRRATFDLIGLPPTAEEVAAFEADTSPDAFAKVVDRLLASPHYGERWGRHWLDVARYSDTKGYVFTEDRRYPYSYTYRDYVVRALNEDRPYDRFVLEQLAADQLDLGDDKSALAGMGFLTVGRRFSNNQQDIIDDRIDVVSRGLMGLTVGCARCHDHKYDAVPTDDYYSLYGVFASCVEPGEPPLIGRPQESEAYNKFMAEVATREKAYNEFRDSKHRELLAELRERVGDYLSQVVVEKLEIEVREEEDLSFNPRELRPQVVRRWQRYLTEAQKRGDPVFVPWQEFAALDRDTFAQGAAAIVERLRAAPADDPAKPMNRVVREALLAKPPQSMLDVAAIYGQALASVDKSWTELVAGAEKSEAPPAGGGAGAQPADKLPDPAAEQLRQVLYGENSPASVKIDDARRVFDRTTQNELTKLRKEVDELKVNSPATPPRAMVLNDAPKPHDPQVFIRGNSGRPGKQVPRRFLQVLSPPDARPFEKGSGRLELARAIASAGNPLTARVIVNRVWQHHLGRPLVSTPSDFGVRSDPPSHPELLDYLAATFVEEGWSLKRLHRRIMLSSVYRQSSEDRPDARAIDEENVWLWRANRRRLDFEATRDALLAVAGQLDPALGGRPIDIFAQPFTPRRTLYAFIDRQDLPGLFRVFDFASPDVSTAERPQTTVPQQALFVMNSPFAIEQAKHLAGRAEVAGKSDAAERVQAMHRLVFARAAEPDEVRLALAFVSAPAANASTQADSELSAWERYAQALLLTNEFLFVD